MGQKSIIVNTPNKKNHSDAQDWAAIFNGLYGGSTGILPIGSKLVVGVNDEFVIINDGVFSLDGHMLRVKDGTKQFLKLPETEVGKKRIAYVVAQYVVNTKLEDDTLEFAILAGEQDAINPLPPQVTIGNIDRGDRLNQAIIAELLIDGKKAEVNRYGKKAIILPYVSSIETLKSDVRFVEDFGVKTKTSEGFNKAIEFCSKNKITLVANGVYEHDSIIILRDNTHLVLNGTLKATTNQYSTIETFDRVTPTPKYTAANNVIIEGIGTINANANGIGMENSESSPLRIHHAKNVTIKGISIKNVNKHHAIEIGGSKNVLIDGVKFNGLVRPDESAIKFGESIQIENIKQMGTGGAIPYDNTHSENITITNCIFESDETASVHVGVGSHYYEDDRYRNIKITGNTFKGVKKPCIIPCGWENVIISDNTVIDCEFNFVGYVNYKTVGIENGLITNNSISGMGSNKPTELEMIDQCLIQVYVSDNVVISNNSIKDIKQGFLYIVSSKNIKVEGNSVVNYALANKHYSKDFVNGIMFKHYDDVPDSVNVSITDNYLLSGSELTSRPIHIPSNAVNDTLEVRNNILKGSVPNVYDLARFNKFSFKNLYEGKKYIGSIELPMSISNFDRVYIDVDLGDNWIKTYELTDHSDRTRYIFSDIFPANSSNYIRFQKFELRLSNLGKTMTIANNTTLQGDMGGNFDKINADGSSNLNNTSCIVKIYGTSFNKSW